MTGGETLASRWPERRRRRRHHCAALQKKTRAKWRLRIRFIKPEISHVVPTLVRSMNNALRRTAVYIKKSALYWQHVNHNVARTMAS